MAVSISKIMNEGEESFDEVGEGHARVGVNEGAPKSCRCESLCASHDIEP